MPAGPGGDPIRLALDAIDRVHRDGALPRIVVRRGLLRPSRQGYYDPVASQVVVNDATTRPALTMLHETGHIIDLYGLGTSDAFASVVEAELNDWRRAAGGTQALQRLTELGQTIVEPDKARYLRYLTMVEEIWARSYAQYIVTRSAEPELQRQLDMVRQRRPGQTLYIPRQWEDGDFVSVAAEIDRLFQQQGWIVWPSP